MAACKHGWIAAAALLCSAGVARAEISISETSLNHFGRWLGYGWSEGYHAYDECPKCKHGHGRAAAPTYLHWQPLLHKSAPLPAVDSAPPIEEIPAPMPAPAQSSSARPPLRQRVLKPSQVSRPLPIPRLPSPGKLPVFKRLPPVAAGESSSTSELRPASAEQDIPLPVANDRYPLSR
jgi:hypothetical protein